MNVTTQSRGIVKSSIDNQIQAAVFGEIEGIKWHINIYNIIIENK
jgi:hypothetical protein